MPTPWDDWDVPRVVLGTLAVVTVAALVVAASTSAAAFGAYNPAWDGAADLQDLAREVGVDASVVRDVSAYESVDPERTVAILLAPTEAYTAAEAATLRRFLAAGGTLVVADDFGRGANPLLARLEASSRIDPTPLRDERAFYRSPALPVATNVTDTPLTAGVDELVLNHPAGVAPNGARVLVSTSPVAYADGDRDGELDTAETLGSRPVITVEPVDGGTLVVAGDPSLFINVMLERPGNRAFVGNLYAQGDTVLLDASHAGALPPLALAVLVLRDSAWAQVLLGLLGLAGVVAWQRGSIDGWLDRDVGPPAAIDPAMTEDALVAYLRENHPTWDESRVRRVVAGLMASRGESAGHD